MQSQQDSKKLEKFVPFPETEKNKDQEHSTGRMKHSKTIKQPTNELDQAMEGLKLKDGTLISVADLDITYDKDSKFDVVVWSGFCWKACLTFHADREITSTGRHHMSLRQVRKS
jgi:hypothetical protein